MSIMCTQHEEGRFVESACGTGEREPQPATIHKTRRKRESCGTHFEIVWGCVPGARANRQTTTCTCRCVASGPSLGHGPLGFFDSLKVLPFGSLASALADPFLPSATAPCAVPSFSLSPRRDASRCRASRRQCSNRSPPRRAQAPPYFIKSPSGTAAAPLGTWVQPAAAPDNFSSEKLSFAIALAVVVSDPPVSGSPRAIAAARQRRAPAMTTSARVVSPSRTLTRPSLRRPTPCPLRSRLLGAGSAACP